MISFHFVKAEFKDLCDMLYDIEDEVPDHQFRIPEKLPEGSENIPPPKQAGQLVGGRVIWQFLMEAENSWHYADLYLRRWLDYQQAAEDCSKGWLSIYSEAEYRTMAEENASTSQAHYTRARALYFLATNSTLEYRSLHVASITA